MNDPFAGMGGSYIVDPKTQTRRRVEGPTADQPKAQPEPEPPAAPAPVVKSPTKE